MPAGEASERSKGKPNRRREALQQAKGGGRVKSETPQGRRAGRSSLTGAGALTGTRMIAAAVAATGMMVWRTMQRGQWSASDSKVWV